MRLFWVDAFADKVGSGNPAAVVPLGTAPFPSDSVCQRIAFENGLAETAFYRFTGIPGRYHLRWFTPEQEVDLCGHATLAAAFVVLRCDVLMPDFGGQEVIFDTASGPLVVRAPEALATTPLEGQGAPLAVLGAPNISPTAINFQEAGTATAAADALIISNAIIAPCTIITAGALATLELIFPSRPPTPMTPLAAPNALFEALGLSRSDALFIGKARDYIIEVSTPEQVYAIKPDLVRLAAVDDALCVIVSAKTHLSGAAGPHVVSRVWCPGAAVPEDPVTGSAHCTVVPYFANEFGTTQALVCRQASPRGGTLVCEMRNGGLVSIQGTAVLYMKGEIAVTNL